MVGLNKIGLRRAGYDQAAIQELMAAYRVIYRSGLRWVEILEQLRTRFPDRPGRAVLRVPLRPPPAASSPSVAPRPAPPSSSATTVEAEPEPEVRVKFG